MPISIPEPALPLSSGMGDDKSFTVPLDKDNDDSGDEVSQMREH